MDSQEQKGCPNKCLRIFTVCSDTVVCAWTVVEETGQVSCIAWHHVTVPGDSVPIQSSQG